MPFSIFCICMAEVQLLVFTIRTMHTCCHYCRLAIIWTLCRWQKPREKSQFLELMEGRKVPILCCYIFPNPNFYALMKCPVRRYPFSPIWGIFSGDKVDIFLIFTRVHSFLGSGERFECWKIREIPNKILLFGFLKAFAGKSCFQSQFMKSCFSSTKRHFWI